MNKYLLMAAVFALPISAHAYLSDKEAKSKAQSMIVLVDKAKKDFQSALETNDRAGYYEYVHKPLSDAVQNWPQRDLKNRAIFPYFQCMQTVNDYLNYTESFLVKDSVRNRQYRERVNSDFNKSYQACKASIKKPDMSLKEIE